MHPNLKNIIRFVQNEKITLMAIRETVKFCIVLMTDTQASLSIPANYKDSSNYIKMELLPCISKHREEEKIK